MASAKPNPGFAAQCLNRLESGSRAVAMAAQQKEAVLLKRNAQGKGRLYPLPGTGRRATNPETGRTYTVPGTTKKYRASRPGDVPATQLGKMAQSVASSTTRTGKLIKAAFFSQVPYDAIQEYGGVVEVNGHQITIEKRPHWRKMWNMERTDLQRVFEANSGFKVKLPEMPIV